MDQWMGWLLFAAALVSFAGVVAFTEAYLPRGRGKILAAALVVYFVASCVGLSVGFNSAERGIFLGFATVPIAIGYAVMSMRTQ